MADDKTTSTTAPADTGSTSSTADVVDNAHGEDSLRAEMKALIKQRDELKGIARDAEKRAKAAADAEAKRQREAGDWESVAKKYEAELAEYKPRLERLSQLEERENARLDGVREELAKLTTKLPKAIKDTIPDGGDPDATLRMVRALHEVVLSKPPAADPAATPTSGKTRDPYSLPPDEARRVAREMPLEELAEIRKQRLGLFRR